MQTSYGRQKSNADHRIRDLEFEERDRVYLKISPMKGVVIFGMKYKLSPLYVGPYEILQRVGKVTYELKLRTELSLVHPVFMYSCLKSALEILSPFFLFKALV